MTISRAERGGAAFVQGDGQSLQGRGRRLTAFITGASEAGVPAEDCGARWRLCD